MSMKAPMNVWLALTALLLPLTGSACERELKACQREIITLISYRAEAISAAFGNFYGGRAEPLQIKFPKLKDPMQKQLHGGISCDASNRTLWISRAVVGMAVPNPMSSAMYYWPFYQRAQLRRDFPVVEVVDNALWGAFLRDAANAQGLTWPHEGCNSGVIRERLPCEMLTSGLARFVKAVSEPIFNENRLDRIWPESLTAFDRHVSGANDREYREVERLGGLMLVRPLIKEFGVLPTFAYVARTPFVVEDDNVHTSALKYQERARQELGQGDPRPSANTVITKVQPPPLLD
jgi:hypothetical protein